MRTDAAVIHTWNRHTLPLESVKCTTGSYCQQKLQMFHCFSFCPALQRPGFILKLSHDLHHVKQMAVCEYYVLEICDHRTRVTNAQPVPEGADDFPVSVSRSLSLPFSPSLSLSFILKWIALSPGLTLY